MPLCILVVGGPGYAIAFSSGQQVFYSSGNFATCYYPYEFYDKIFAELGIPTQYLVDNMSEFGLNAIIVSSQGLERANKIGINLHFKNMYLRFATKNYQIYLTK
jgi:hypothetical protein